MNIAMVGSGYVGLVSGTCFAEMGNKVICVDNDPRKIEMLKNNIVPIYEPGLQELVEHNAIDGRLSFTTDIAEAVQASQIIFIGQETTTSFLYRTIAWQLGTDLRPIPGPPRKGDLRRSLLDCSEAFKELGWSPLYTLDAGIRETIEFFKNKESLK